MCGIVGVFWKDPHVSLDDLETMRRACVDKLETLQFRGPDEQHLVQVGSALLGHTRLSIIDLSTGSQPIFNEDRTVAVVLNGEIYNFRELRHDLESRGHVFRTLTDTEVIVHLYEDVGEEVFSYLNGMFAIIIHDQRTNVMLCARDRTGEKPLLYCETAKSFLFSSEIKAMLKAPDMDRDLDLEGLALYLNSLAVPAPHTIFRQIRKLKPAHYLKVKGQTLEMMKYWDPRIAVDWGMDEETVQGRFHELFSDAVRIRTVADVPLGVFLSGGIDSSAVVAFMSQHCPGKVKTFSVGFGDEIDERPYARMVAERYHTDHTELFIDQKLEDVVLDVLEYYDEPFGDSSAVPSYMISREARKHVKVILTGDGGDELFAGYESYLNQKYQLFERISSRLYQEMGKLAVSITGRDLTDVLYPRRSWEYAFNHWHLLRSIYTEQEVVRLVPIHKGFIRDFFRNGHWLHLTAKDALSVAYAYDMNYYLPDDLLKKMDMASMLASLECRAPFLDHRLIEFSMSIPPHLKVKNNIPKYLLKASLRDHLPEVILQRPKIGFGAPVESWVRNQLKEVVCDFLMPGCSIESILPRQCIEDALNHVFAVQKCLDYRVPYKLWLLFVLEVWMKKYC